MRHLFLVTAATLGLCLPARAQSPAITEIFPPGGKSGQTVQLTVAGTALNDVQKVLVSGTGVTAEPAPGGSATACPLKVSIAADAEVGLREVRIITRGGASNAGRLWVGQYPDLAEKEPNDTLAQPQVLGPLPGTVSGRADRATDTDVYSFRARAGETWVFSLNAARHVSQLDGYLALLDERGRLKQFAMDGFERDPRLVYTFKTDGTYLLQVRDSMYRGGAGYTYRLTAGRLPVVTRWTPLGGRRGESVMLAVDGVNLGSVRAHQLELPADPERETARVVLATPSGPTNAIDLVLGDMPELAEHEPNEAPPSGMWLSTLPAAVSGRIGQKRDRDLYGVGLAEKQALRIEVVARRIGSRLDSVLRVLDATGKEVTANDDALGKDSRILFTAPTAGKYFVEVRSLSGNGGDDYYYRLELGDPPQPDFSLVVTPDSPTVPAGAAVALTVTARRVAFNGEIALRLEGLPEGVTASPAVLRAGQNSAVFTLSAPAGAAGHGRIRVIASAKIGDRTVERVAVGQERYQPPLANAQQARMRDTEMVVSAVGPAAPYTLETAAPLVVKAGQKLEVTVKVARTPAFKENVAVTVLGLPPNVKASALTINKDKTEGKLTLEAAGNAPVGETRIVVQGNGGNRIVAAPAAPLTIQPAK